MSYLGFEIEFLIREIMAKKKSKKKGKGKKDLEKKKLLKLKQKKKKEKKRKEAKKKEKKKKQVKKKEARKKEKKKQQRKAKENNGTGKENEKTNPLDALKLKKPAVSRSARSRATVTGSVDRSSNYRGPEAIKKLRSLKTREELLAFTKGEKRITVSKVIPAALKRLK